MKNGLWFCHVLFPEETHSQIVAENAFSKIILKLRTTQSLIIFPDIRKWVFYEFQGFHDFLMHYTWNWIIYISPWYNSHGVHWSHMFLDLCNPFSKTGAAWFLCCDKSPPKKKKLAQRAKRWSEAMIFHYKQQLLYVSHKKLTKPKVFLLFLLK